MSSTVTVNPPKYSDDPIVEDFMQWVRHAPWDSDAMNNIPVILKDYDRRKTAWQRIKCLFQ